MTAPVLSKKDFVRRYSLGEFGNRSPTWDEPPQERRDGLFHIRNRVAGGATYYDLSWDDLLDNWHRLAVTEDMSQWYVSQMCPTEHTILQGEVAPRPLVAAQDLWILTYTTVRKPMRQALADCTLHASGLAVRDMLQRTMNEYSFDWLCELALRYPFHVIEFTVLDIEWGTVPLHNTLFWEVRKY